MAVHERKHVELSIEFVKGTTASILTWHLRSADSVQAIVTVCMTKGHQVSTKRLATFK